MMKEKTIKDKINYAHSLSKKFLNSSRKSQTMNN